MRDYPAEHGNGWTAELTVENGVTAVAYIYDDKAATLRPGDTVSFTSVSQLADSIGGEDVDYYFSRGKYLILRKVSDFEITERYSGSALRYLRLDIARAAVNAVRNVFPEDAAGVALGLVNGDKTLLKEDLPLSYSMQRSGIYHIATVSGLHVSIITGFFYLLFGRKKLLPLILFPALLGFAAVSGFRPSVIRAVVMQIFVISAPLFMRENDNVTSLSFALALLLCVNPFSAKDVGLQLSFAATLGIILFCPPVMDKFLAWKPVAKMKKGRGKDFLVGAVGTVCVTMSALSFTVPLSAAHFGYFSLISPISNLLISWAVAPAFILSLLAAALGAAFVPVGAAVAAVASVFIRYVAFIASVCGRMYASSLYTENPAVVIWLLIVYAAFIAFFATKQPFQRIFAPAAAAAVSLALILVGTALWYDLRPGYSVTAVDVGQGQAIVIASGGKVALIDCGGSSASDTGDGAARYIRSIGGDRVDVLIITHFQQDHMNGVANLCGQMRLMSAILPPRSGDITADDEVYALAEENGAAVTTCVSDLTFTLGNAEVTVFAPLGEGDINERCLSILVSCGGFDTLVTGDLGAETELTLIAEKDLPDAECLIVGHHGSNYSTSEELLAAIKPEIAVVSCGRNNSYGHPGKYAVERIERAGAALYITARSGNITIYSEN